MSLKIPLRFFAQSQRGQYQPAATDECETSGPQRVASTRLSLLECWNTLWNYSATKRRKQLDTALGHCTAALETLGRQIEELESKVVAHQEAVQRNCRSDRKRALVQLRQLKGLERRRDRLQVQHDDITHKMQVLSELKANTDVANIVQSVSKAISSIDVQHSISEVELASDALTESLDDAAELADQLQALAQDHTPVELDEAELLAELERLGDDNDGTSGSSAMLVNMPTAPVAPVLDSQLKPRVDALASALDASASSNSSKLALA